MEPLRIVPERPLVVQVASVVGGFAAGPLLAMAVGAAVAPSGGGGATLGVFGFVGTFLAGLLLWMGLGIVTVVGRFLVGLARRRLPDSPAADGSERLVPTGYGAFLVLGVMAGMGTGVVAGLATSAPFARAVAAWTLAGAVYGGALRALAHHGYLPFPEPD